MKTTTTIKALAASGLLVGGLALGSNVFAQSENAQNGNGVMDRIAEHFNLDQAEVNSFMMQMHEERQTEMQSRMDERLTEQVLQGNITEEQKQLILDKQQELHADMEQNRQELHDWAEENDIDLQYLRMGGPREGKGMRGHGNYQMESDSVES